MANHRMFSNRVANSAQFLQMPAEAQLLFFHMVLRADDDGVVESYPIMRLLGTAPDTFKVLIAKGFIKQINEDQVVLISDWLEHNTIRADRKVDSLYLPKVLEIYPDYEYVVARPRIDVKDNSRRVDSPRSAEDKLSKGKLNSSESTLSHGLRIEEETDGPQRKRKYPNASTVFTLFGRVPGNWKLNRTQLQAAENLFNERGVQQIKTALKFYEENKDQEFCPQILTPRS